ncbi:MAG TPA: hypothetical protein PLA71_00860 [Saccharofermentans sp.]|nr:hypothetical protein [Saccharofermentans sp.]
MKFIERCKQILEAFNPNDHVLEPAKTKVTIIIGRYSPFHIGHAAMVKKAKHPVIMLLVKGTVSSKDKDKNPFPADVQEKIIRNARISKIKDVVQVESADLVKIFDKLRAEGYEPVELIAGEDRIPFYKQMAQNYVTKLNGDLEVTLSDRVMSATEVRNHIKNDDFEGTKERMVNLDKKTYDLIKKYVN